MKFKNMKIAITDEVHLKAVCEVLESMGYRHDPDSDGVGRNFVVSWDDGVYCIYKTINFLSHRDEITLTDLLRMRDEMVKENAKN